jgi:ATP-dependent RNA helicase RhlE
VLVFTRTKHGANKATQQLDRAGIRAAAIHGNKSQGARDRALADFKDARVRVLVATDIAARGIDVDGISHVINLDVPNEPESYVHRIGRTARAGAAGIALSFCDGEERPYLRAIERLTGTRLEVVSDHPFAGGAPAPASDQAPRTDGPRRPAPARHFGRRRR